MAQYEPQYEAKTEGKELEFPGGGQDSAYPAEKVKDPADITIRLWHRERTGSASPTWKAESVLVFMIADLVTASHGRIDDSSPAMLAHFDTSGRALVAAKRIQTAILEFLDCRPGDSLSAAVLIHQPSTEPGGFTVGMAQGALRLAEPGQILLSAETARRLHNIPGIEMRAVAAMTTGGDEHAGLTELVWTPPDQLARLRRPVTGSVAEPDASPPMGATMMVNVPRANTGISKTARSVVGTTGVSTEAKTATTRSQSVGPDKPSGVVIADRDDALPQGMGELSQPSLFTRTRMILAGAALVLVVAVIWAFYPRQNSKPQVHASGSSDGGSGTVSTVPSNNPSGPNGTTPSANKADDSHPTNPGADASSSGNKGPAIKPKPPAKPGTGKPTVKPEPPAESPPDVYDGIFQKDVPNLLKKAKDDEGQGRYEDAKREFSVILKLQPNNLEAREGLRKIEVIQSGR